jgi:hypothetical protein
LGTARNWYRPEKLEMTRVIRGEMLTRVDWHPSIKMPAAVPNPDPDLQ